MKSKLFNILSIIFLSFLIIFYAIRLIHYYKIEHKVYDTSTKLVDVLKDQDNIGDNYVYESNASNNYLYYMGRMWRIISIDSNIKLITEDIQTLLSYNDIEFSNTDIYKWIDASFRESLKDNSYVTDIRLLTEEEYNKLDQTNYLNNKTPYWISCAEACYVDSNNQIKNNKDKLLGVRPVISLSKDVIYSKGNGNMDTPYELYSDAKHILKDTYVGEYVTYSNLLWRVIGQEDMTKLVLEDSIDDIEKFYDNLENKDYLKEGIYNTGSYKNSYLDTESKTEEFNIGALKIGDFFIGEVANIYTMTPYAYSSKSTYVVNSKNMLYVDIITSKYKVRPTVYLDNELFIVSGSGQVNDAYKVGR